MPRLAHALIVLPLLLTAACNVTDNGNGSSTVSLDQNRIDNGTAVLANETVKAADAAGNAIENAGPAIENSAADIKERAGRVAAKADALGNGIDIKIKPDQPADNKTDNKAAPAH